MTARKRSGARPRGDGEAQVEALLSALDHPFMAEIQALRRIILRADPAIRQAVKWNAPSFFVTEHFATFKLHPPTAVQLVLHTGAKARRLDLQAHVQDADGLLKWVAPDRAILTFSDLVTIREKASALDKIVRQWLALVETSRT